MLHLISTSMKILLASLVVGVGLSWANINAGDILHHIGLTPEEIWKYLNEGVDWAVPHVILGSVITVPVWIIVYLLRPPRG